MKIILSLIFLLGIGVNSSGFADEPPPVQPGKALCATVVHDKSHEHASIETESFLNENCNLDKPFSTQFEGYHWVTYVCCVKK